MAYPNAERGSYSSIPAPGNPRETEAWALTEAARRMSGAQSEAVPVDDFLAAVRLNWRLWTIFQAELSEPECELPIDMRQNMLSLCNFVDKRSVEIISTRDRALVGVLINVNRQLAAGLFTQIPSDAAPLQPSQGGAPTNEIV